MSKKDSYWGAMTLDDYRADWGARVAAIEAERLALWGRYRHEMRLRERRAILGRLSELSDVMMEILREPFPPSSWKEMRGRL